jgi:hypothetical protein
MPNRKIDQTRSNRNHIERRYDETRAHSSDFTCLTEERLGFISPAETTPKFSGLSRKASKTQEVFEQIE